MTALGKAIEHALKGLELKGSDTPEAQEAVVRMLHHQGYLDAGKFGIAILSLELDQAALTAKLLTLMGANAHKDGASLNVGMILRELCDESELEVMANWVQGCLQAIGRTKIATPHEQHEQLLKDAAVIGLSMEAVKEKQSPAVPGPSTSPMDVEPPDGSAHDASHWFGGGSGLVRGGTSTRDGMRK